MQFISNAIDFPTEAKKVFTDAFTASVHDIMRPDNPVYAQEFTPFDDSIEVAGKAFKDYVQKTYPGGVAKAIDVNSEVITFETRIASLAERYVVWFETPKLVPNYKRVWMDMVDYPCPIPAYPDLRIVDNSIAAPEPPVVADAVPMGAAENENFTRHVISRVLQDHEMYFSGRNYNMCPFDQAIEAGVDAYKQYARENNFRIPHNTPVLKIEELVVDHERKTYTRICHSVWFLGYKTKTIRSVVGEEPIPAEDAGKQVFRLLASSLTDDGDVLARNLQPFVDLGLATPLSAWPFRKAAPKIVVDAVPMGAAPWIFAAPEPPVVVDAVPMGAAENENFTRHVIDHVLQDHEMYFSGRNYNMCPFDQAIEAGVNAYEKYARENNFRIPHNTPVLKIEELAVDHERKTYTRICHSVWFLGYKTKTIRSIVGEEPIPAEDAGKQVFRLLASSLTDDGDVLARNLQPFVDLGLATPLSAWPFRKSA